MRAVAAPCPAGLFAGSSLRISADGNIAYYGDASTAAFSVIGETSP